MFLEAQDVSEELKSFTNNHKQRKVEETTHYMAIIKRCNHQL